MSSSFIKLRGVEVHNLKQVDLDIPHRQLVVFCGVSGSGKTSLALDTLYAEGQRRYIECFSAYTRQFLERLEKPAAELIDGIPPAIAVTHRHTLKSSRSTVGTVTETTDFLRLLWARVGMVICRGCGQPVRSDSSQSAARILSQLPLGTKLMVVFRFPLSGQNGMPETCPPENNLTPEAIEASLAALREDGFVRIIAGGRTFVLEGDLAPAVAAIIGDPAHSEVVIDRLTAGGENLLGRLRDSLEMAMQKADGRCGALVQIAEGEQPTSHAAGNGIYEIDGTRWRRQGFSNKLTCETCRIDYLPPEPRLLSFNSPLGACPQCEGFGNIIDIDMDLVVPDPAKSIAEGAIAPWNTPAYAHELKELLDLAEDFGIPTAVPFRTLTEEQVRIVREGVPERNFGGLRGFFAWLERRKYKMHLRVFLSRWRSYRTCPACNGARLRPEALAVRIGGLNLFDVSALRIDAAREFFQRHVWNEWEKSVSRVMLQQVESRLQYLCEVGLGYLTLDRTLRTLSGGESQRAMLTSALGSNLVNMLYVLDEPSVGLHPRDVDRLIGAVERLRDRGNTVVVVEHEEGMIRAADHLVEIGPGAGDRGGKVVFQGTLDEMRESTDSLTADYLLGRRGVATPETRRKPNHGWVRLTGARGNNLKNITVEFPLGVLCLVTGVSGAGKSSLVQDTLYGALCRRKRKDADKPLPFDDVFGDGQIDEVMLIDQSPLSRSPRSNPVTYVKAFDDIRAVFAETVEARARNFTPSHFSFNVDGGRCTECEGDGYKAIDMQFLADVYMKCPACNGARYRREILDVTYRGLNIADVLEMTVREAFGFFRGQNRAQAKLKRLMDVGLDYLRLGQAANTLSSGEAQRLKLAGYLSAAKRNRTLFILDEPTTGLHFSDVVQLLDCFDALVNVGHSLIVVEHNLQIMKAADYIIDLGPEAGEDGGQVVAVGTPEKVALESRSITGRLLAEALGGKEVLANGQR